VVSTRAGGVEEAVVEGKNAYLADPGDSDGLAQAMIRMARVPDLAGMGALGPPIVKEQFRIEQTWKNYRDLFLALGARE
jgi:glycosyltransferase involved in cell wall biosynthesis